MTPSSEIVPNTLFEALEQAASLHGDREFLVFGRRQESETFAGLLTRTNHAAAGLRRLGVGPGERVAIGMSNSVDWVATAFGAAQIGAVLVPISTRLTAREVAHFINLSRPRLLVMDQSVRGRNLETDWVGPLASLVEHQPTVVIRSTDSTRSLGLDFAATLASASDPIQVPTVGDLGNAVALREYPELAGVAAIMSTSGTTAMPKGVILAHRGLLRLALEVGRQQFISPDDRFYSVSPFFHCSGFMHGVLTCLLAGCTLFSTDQYDPDESWDVISQERITVYHGSALPLREMSARKRPELLKHGSTLDRAWFNTSVAERVQLEHDWGARICGLFGLTETGGCSSITTADDSASLRHESAGRPLPGIEIKIVDPVSNHDVAGGQPGEIYVRGWNLMRGYFRDPAATKNALGEDGWLRTGDEGALTGSFLEFRSRSKDIIRVGGENVAPQEIEEVICEYPGVAEAAVVAAADERLMEVPVAFVIPYPGITLDEEALIQYCRQSLASFKVPRQVIITSELPRTDALRKVQKYKLRKFLANGSAGGPASLQPAESS